MSPTSKTKQSKTKQNMTDARKNAAAILLDTGSILINDKEPFTYTSGRTGPVYVDCHRLISFPEERKTLMSMAREIISGHCPDIEMIAGGATAGIPYAAFLAQNLDLPMVYVRKEPKGFGRMAQIEGVMDEKGMKTLMVEDLQNFGVSIKNFVSALRKAGAVVENALVVFEYGHESTARDMDELGVSVHALTDWNVVLAVARETGRIDEETLESVRLFLHNPEDWMK